MPNKIENKIIDLAFSLCAISSITYEEQVVQKFIVDWALENKLLVEKIKAPLGEERYSLLLYRKKLSKYKFIFCTHIDTVPPFIAPRIHDGKLWGRGSCDAKGIAALMLTLLNDYSENIAVLLTVGEEDSSDGAKACAKALAGQAEYLIVGEPTGLQAASGQKGSLNFDLIAHGEEAHSALPDKGFSANHALIKTLAPFLDEKIWPSDKKWGDTTFNLGKITGGRARNILAGRAKAECIMRLAVPVEQILEQIKKDLPNKIELKVNSALDPFAYFVPKGLCSFVAAFGSDAPYLKSLGQPILCGPGDLALAHRDDEHIEIDALLEGFSTYRQIMSEL